MQNFSITGPIERESLALFKRRKKCSQRSTLNTLNMDCYCKVCLPILLLCKLLTQYFEKEIYTGMCTFHHKPFLVKPQGFLRLTAKTRKNFTGSRKSRLYSTSMHSYGSQNNFNLGIHWLFGIIDIVVVLDEICQFLKTAFFIFISLLISVNLNHYIFLFGL